MQLSDIQLWHTYFVPNCHHVRPRPKDKYVVVVGIDDGRAWGFLINSRVSNFLLSKSELLVCEAPIHADEHRYLRHDSFVDCHTLYDFYAWDFQSERGALSEIAIQSILKAVQACPTIARKHKRMILENDPDKR